jgi:hypothetical protein
MHRWIGHRFSFYFAALTASAAIVAWALGGEHAAETVGSVAGMLLVLAMRALKITTSIRIAIARRRPVKDVDRERRHEEREQRRRAREGAMRRYGPARGR